MRWERAGHGNGIKSSDLVRKDIKFSVELVKVAEKGLCDIGDMSKGISIGKGDVW